MTKRKHYQGDYGKRRRDPKQVTFNRIHQEELGRVVRHRYGHNP
jgi:hypothetical protein